MIFQQFKMKKLTEVIALINDKDSQNVFNSALNSNLLKQRNSVESEIVFKRGLDQFNLNAKSFTRSRKPKYAENWIGGFPMYYDSNKSIVYYDWSDTHSLIFGSTGSKKSRLIVMPTVYMLAAAGESMIISDPKAEIFQRTSEHLSQNGYQLYVINLRNPKTGNAWNPLYIPYCFYKSGEIDKACELVNDIAYNLTLADISLKDPFWDYSAGDLLSGLILLLFKYCKLNDLSNQSANIENLLQLRRELFDEKTRSEHPLWKIAMEDIIIASALTGTKTAPEKTKASILCTFDEKIRFLATSHSLIGMLSDNDFDISSIRYKKSAIYLIVPDEKTTYHRVVSMFIKQSYEYLIYKSYASTNTQQAFLRINYILDEFSSLPPIKDFPAMISAARSRNIRYMLVIQSQHQLVTRYADEAQTILSNCMNWYFLTSREVNLLENISALCGTDDKGKPLFPAYTLQRLSKEKGECLILSGRLKPFLTQLADIDVYDKKQYKSLPLKKREDLRKKRLSFTEEESSADSSRIPPTDPLERSDLQDIQKELELKFDELFGPISEEGDYNDD